MKSWRFWLDKFWPMQRIGFSFVDMVSGESVSYYRLFWTKRIVLAVSAFSLFRVETDINSDEKVTHHE